MSLLELTAMLRSRGSQPGLTRIRQALALLGSPERRLRAVHIAGTNGKGSTARMLQRVLTEAGYRTASFTSPAVLSPTELMAIDGESITEDALEALSAEMLTVLGEDAAGLTEFEWMTAAALLWFARERVDIAIVECGMGGALDATNVFESKLACVFTPIALDHTAFLGDTVEEIAQQKSGILRDGCAVVSAPDQSPEALGVLLEACAQRGAVLRMSTPAKSQLQNGRLSFMRGDKVYTLCTANRVQADNALTVLETVEALRERGFFIEEEAVTRALAATDFPCRQELLDTKPPILLDGAHNPHGIARLCETIDTLWETPPVLLCGMLGDKDVAAAIALLETRICTAVCCTPYSPRALAADLLAKQFSQADVTACDDPIKAFALAKQEALNRGCALVIGGSFYIAEPLRKYIFGGAV